MSARAALAALLLVAGAAAWAADPAPPASAPAAPRKRDPIHRARAAAKDFAARLAAHLDAQLAAGTKPEASDVCRAKAPELIAELSKDELVVRRVAPRPRNAANRATGLEAALFDEILERHVTGTPTAEAFQRDDATNTLLYVRPIVLTAPCMACHAAPPAAPGKDAAPGFKVGDLYGLVAVRAPLHL